MSNERGLLYSYLSSDSYKFYYAEDYVNLNVQEELDKLKSQNIEVRGLLLEEYNWIKKLNVKWSFKFPKNISVPVFSFVSDYWLYPREFRRFVEKHQIDVLISMHQNSYGFIKRFISPTIVIKYIPFCVDVSRFASENKTIGIFNPNQIHELNPLRNKIIEELDSGVENNLKYKVEVFRKDLEHPGKRKNDRTAKLVDAYGWLMSRANFIVTCTSRFNISIRKYQEIACSGGYILGNLTGLPEHDHFKNITHDMTISNISERLKDLDLRDNYDVDFYRNYYSPESVAAMLEEIMRDKITHDEYRIAKMGRLYNYEASFTGLSRLKFMIYVKMKELLLKALKL